MTLQFSDELPPGVRVIQDRGQSQVDRDKVRRDLTANPNKWLLVYGTDEISPSSEGTARKWKSDGFKVALSEPIPESKIGRDGNAVVPANWKYKIWLMFDPDSTTHKPAPGRYVRAEATDQMQSQPAVQSALAAVPVGLPPRPVVAPRTALEVEETGDYKSSAPLTFE